MKAKSSKKPFVCGQKPLGKNKLVHKWYEYEQGYEQGKKDAEEAYKTRYSVLNLCHKTIATDRVSQDNLIRKQTLDEVLRIWNKLEKEDNKMVAEMGHQVGEFRIWLIKELKEAGK